MTEQNGPLMDPNTSEATARRQEFGRHEPTGGASFQPAVSTTTRFVVERFSADGTTTGKEG